MSRLCSRFMMVTPEGQVGRHWLDILRRAPFARVQGYSFCSPGCFGEQNCPDVCLGVEVLLCFPNSVLGTRFYLQDQMVLQNTQCDDNLIACEMALVQLSCICDCAALLSSAILLTAMRQTDTPDLRLWVPAHPDPLPSGAITRQDQGPTTLCLSFLLLLLVSPVPHHTSIFPRSLARGQTTRMSASLPDSSTASRTTCIAPCAHNMHSSSAFISVSEVSRLFGRASISCAPAHPPLSPLSLLSTQVRLHADSAQGACARYHHLPQHSALNSVLIGPLPTLSRSHPCPLSPRCVPQLQMDARDRGELTVPVFPTTAPQVQMMEMPGGLVAQQQPVRWFPAVPCCSSSRPRRPLRCSRLPD